MTSGRRLALRLAVLAVLVGATSGLLAALSSVGSCSASSVAGGSPGFVDPVCAGLVREMAARVGAAVAIATVIVVLTMIGLSRLAAWRQSPNDGWPAS